MISDEKIKEYRDVITYPKDIHQRLGIDELLLLLSECIGDKKIDKVVNKYVNDYYALQKRNFKNGIAIQNIKEIIRKVE